MSEAATPVGIPPLLSQKLNGLASRFRRITVLKGLALGVIVLLASIGAAFAVDFAVGRLDKMAALNTPYQIARTLVALGVGLGGLAWFTLRPLRRRYTLRGLAETVEMFRPEFGERLVSTVQLAASTEPETLRGSPAMIAALTDETVALAKDRDFEGIVTTDRLNRLWAAALFLVVMFGGMWVLFPEMMGSLARRFVNPTEGVALAAPDTRIDLDYRKTVQEGESVRITAKVSGARPNEAVLYKVDLDGTDETRTEIARAAADADGVFEFPAYKIAENLTFRVAAADAVTDRQSIRMLVRPKVLESSLTVTPPAYARAFPGRGPATFPLAAKGEALADARPAGLIGSEVAFRFETNIPVKVGKVKFGSGETTEVALEPAPGGAKGVIAYTARFRLERATAYTVYLRSEEDAVTEQALAGRIEALEDNLAELGPVALSVRKSPNLPAEPLLPVNPDARDGDVLQFEARPNDELIIAFGASDDVGLEKAEIRFGYAGDLAEGKPAPAVWNRENLLSAVPGAKPGATGHSVRLSHVLDLGEMRRRFGETEVVYLRAVVADGAPAPEGRTRERMSVLHEIRISKKAVTPEQKDLAQRQAEVKADLKDVIKKLEQAKAEVEKLKNEQWKKAEERKQAEQALGRAFDRAEEVAGRKPENLPEALRQEAAKSEEKGRKDVARALEYAAQTAEKAIENKEAAKAASMAEKAAEQALEALQQQAADAEAKPALDKLAQAQKEAAEAAAELAENTKTQPLAEKLKEAVNDAKGPVEAAKKEINQAKDVNREAGKRNSDLNDAAAKIDEAKKKVEEVAKQFDKIAEQQKLGAELAELARQQARLQEQTRQAEMALEQLKKDGIQTPEDKVRAEQLKEELESLLREQKELRKDVVEQVNMNAELKRDVLNDAAKKLDQLVKDVQAAKDMQQQLAQKAQEAANQAEAAKNDPAKAQAAAEKAMRLAQQQQMLARQVERQEQEAKQLAQELPGLNDQAAKEAMKAEQQLGEMAQPQQQQAAENLQKGDPKQAAQQAQMAAKAQQQAQQALQKAQQALNQAAQQANQQAMQANPMGMPDPMQGMQVGEAVRQAQEAAENLEQAVKQAEQLAQMQPGQMAGQMMGQMGEMMGQMAGQMGMMAGQMGMMGQMAGQMGQMAGQMGQMAGQMGMMGQMAGGMMGGQMMGGQMAGGMMGGQMMGGMGMGMGALADAQAAQQAVQQALQQAAQQAQGQPSGAMSGMGMGMGQGMMGQMGQGMMGQGMGMGMGQAMGMGMGMGMPGDPSMGAMSNMNGMGSSEPSVKELPQDSADTRAVAVDLATGKRFDPRSRDRKTGNKAEGRGTEVPDDYRDLVKRYHQAVGSAKEGGR
jgi:hypothetical protein